MTCRALHVPYLPEISSSERTRRTTLHHLGRHPGPTARRMVRDPGHLPASRRAHCRGKGQGSPFVQRDVAGIRKRPTGSGTSG